MGVTRVKNDENGTTPPLRKIHDQVSLHACKVTIEMHERMYICVIVLSVDELPGMIRYDKVGESFLCHYC